MTQKNAQELLDKYHSGTATKDEVARLETWYLKFVNSESKFSEAQLLADQSKSIVGLHRHIRKVQMRRLWLNIGVAASILVSVFSGLFFYIKDHNDLNQHIISDVNDVAGGGPKATLILANGKKINLEAVHNGQVTSQGGVEVRKTNEGELVYTVKSETPIDAAVEFNSIETPRGGQYQVILPDGTHVYLNSASSIKYPTRFTGNERRVEVTGEAYLEVAKRKNMPFKVFTDEQVIEVLGTHFNVSAYRDDVAIKTTLLEGSVKITDHGRTEMLIPGQQAEVTSAGITLKASVNTADVIAWKNGYFVFNEKLTSIMNKIARWYDVEIIYQDNIDPDQEFGGKISRAKKLSSALKIIELTGNVHFKIQGRRVIVMQ